MLPHRPVIFRGVLDLQKREVPIRLHLISGNGIFPPGSITLDCGVPLLKLQRTTKLDATQRNNIWLRTEFCAQHSILIGLPDVNEGSELEALQRAQILKNNFVDYLDTRRRVGFAQYNILGEEESFTLHVFPHCQFSANFVQRYVPAEFAILVDSAYLLFILTRNTPGDIELFRNLEILRNRIPPNPTGRVQNARARG